MAVPAALLSAENLTVIRQGRRILDHVSLAVAQGDFLTIVGPNGAGKTTLLKVLMGLERAGSGTLARRDGLKIGYMPQKLVPDPLLPITVQRFLQLKRTLDPTALPRVVEQTGLMPLLPRMLYQLSGGEVQRVLLARALLGKPDLLVLDEPVQNLDISGQMAFYALLDRLHRDNGLAVLMVSHDLHMVMARTKRVICLFHHVCCHGTPDTVSQHPEFIALFGSQMAQLVGVYQHLHDHCHEEGLGVRH